jgi:[ribosomal protein S5]-alanine N-acetyltransferase
MALTFPVRTARAAMRPFVEEDLHALYSDPRVSRWIGDFSDPARTRRELRHNLRHQAEHGYAFWAVEDGSGNLIGEAGLNHLEAGPEVEVGYTVAPELWGRGLATELAERCVEIGFTELGLDRVVAVVLPGNLASRRVLEKVGLREAGRRIAYGRPHLLYERPRTPGFEHP